MSQYSTNLKKWNEREIDKRTGKEIEDRIEELAASYVPEWQFDRENPDMGSVIAKIFAKQMAGNIQRYNQVLDKYHTEFVNMVGLPLQPAKPAKVMVLMNLVQNTIPGVEVSKGTKLLADAEESEEQIVFETLHSLYVTNASVHDVFMTEKTGGRVIPLKGKFKKQKLVDFLITEESGEEQDQEEKDPADLMLLKKFRLFAGDGEGIGQNALLIYHTTALDVEGDDIYIRITGCPELIEKIGEGSYRFLYCTKKGLLPVDEAEPLNDGRTVRLKKREECAKVERKGKRYSLLVLETKEPVCENYMISGISISSSGKAMPAEAVHNSNSDLPVDSFSPFGDTLALFQECYLGHDSYFGKAGALIRLEFDVSYEEHRLQSFFKEEEPDLKIIKRKAKTVRREAAADAWAQEVVFEYFNGIGWKKLNCNQEIGGMFSGENKGRYQIEFICPVDWEAGGAGAYDGRSLRLRLLKVDNCYLYPCVHHYPHVKHLKISYSYEGNFVEAEHLTAVSGTKKRDFSTKARIGNGFAAFVKGEYREDALYLGISRKLENGPVSILFQLEDDIRCEGVKCIFEYSTLKGFKQMKVLDYTMDMSRTGTVLFMPPSDMHAVTLEGKQACWIRVTRMDQEAEKRRETLPVITDIRFNAVMAANVETREEEDFYLDESTPDMTIRLGVSNILDVDLWVNEMGRHSRPQMLQMAKEMPEAVKLEYDIMGEISSFYVKWLETDRFDDAPSRRCYLLDRMNNLLIFGNGIQTDIPRVMDNAAFRVTVRCCNGQAGNVGPGSIHGTMENILFLDEITNPAKAYGGSDMESVESSLRRGANLLKSRKKLVCMDDYIQEILSFSDDIDKVKGIVGQTIHGKDSDHVITFVVLLKDFSAGSYSFHNVAETLKEHLQESGELTILPEDLLIEEPIFARVSVDIWIEMMQMDDSFEIQNLLRESLEQYLNPVSSKYSTGWEIGVLPKKSQLLMRLSVLKGKAVVKRMAATVQYTDDDGIHEVNLDDMKENPFLVCCSGTHQINVTFSENKTGRR